jgi:hypothetical protein
MCSSGGEISQSDEALQKAQTAMTNTLNQDYSTTFAEQQSVLNNQMARLNAIAANPMGYTTAQLHNATTNINENTASAAKNAVGAAAAYAASHGGSAGDVGGGPESQAVGQAVSGAAQSKAAQLSALSQQNEGLKQQNFWNAIGGLNSVGSELGGAGGTAIGGAGNAAGSAVGAGSGALAAQQAGWQDVAGVIGGIASLGTAGAAIGKDFSGGGSTPGTLPLAPASTVDSSVYGPNY